VAGHTTRIGLGVTVLVRPYRPPLPTAKWVASLQVLSGERLTLGVGAGWMPAVFRALGVPRAARGRLTDETLAFLHCCFAQDEVEVNGQTFLFWPRPARPPLLVGGSGEHCRQRVVRHADGWMPTGLDPATLAAPVADLRARMAATGKPAPEVIPVGRLPLEELVATRERLAALAEVGVTGVVHAARDSTTDEFRRITDDYAAVLS
jgi:alkanesulfonate monooxygenase SsuD/methylene tetrahydromethanopterin reductase-like flavin-dependent oxidoreductase (luciferase family)